MNLAINNVTNLCNFVGKMVCVCVSLLRTFITLSTLQNPFDKHIAYFKSLAWATSFANQASRKFIYLPYRARGKKSYCHTLISPKYQGSTTLSEGSTAPSARKLWKPSHPFPSFKGEGDLTVPPHPLPPLHTSKDDMNSNTHNLGLERQHAQPGT